MRVAVLIPALNEEEALPLVLADLARRAPDRVVVVDNGSADRTAEVARAAGAEVVSEPKRGYGAACLAGLKHLTHDPPDVLIFLDGDHSDDVNDLPRLLAPLHDGAVIIRGTRLVAAACFLESGHDQEADDRFGTRHRAALSVSSQTDCLVLVVSEETGQVRVAQDGVFSRPMEDEGDIKKILTSYLVGPQSQGGRKRLSFPLGNWARLKVRRN